MDQVTEELEHLSEQDFTQLDIFWREDFEEWVIKEPRIGGETLRIIRSGRDKEKPLNGHRYWTHPYFEDRTLVDLKEAEARGEDRISNDSITK